MPACLQHSLTWLACPVTPAHAEAFWRWLRVWRERGSEVVLSPLKPTMNPVSLCMWQGMHGLVLWDDDPQAKIWAALAWRHGLPVRRPDPERGELQDWLPDCPSGQSRM